MIQGKRILNWRVERNHHVRPGVITRPTNHPGEEEQQVHTFVEQFAALPEPRVDRTKRHQRIDMVVMALCAVICGAEGGEDMEMVAAVHQRWCETFLEWPHGSPSHATFRRVFARLAPEECGGRLLAWVQEVASVTPGEGIAMDGNTLRRSHDRAAGKAPMHMVSAWASAPRMVWGQGKTDDKSHAITAMPEWLRVLELPGCIVTIDALGCQRAMAATLGAQGAADVLARTGHQGTWHADVQVCFDTAPTTGCKAVPHPFAPTIAGDHGRSETRRGWATRDMAWLDEPGHAGSYTGHRGAHHTRRAVFSSHPARRGPKHSARRARTWGE
jgi:predicted transposase YbfD/YdcC